jgi:predicted RNase H-like HicB family nuclease
MKKMNTQMAPAILAICRHSAGGHYLAEVPWLLEVLACGKTADETEALALRVLADQLDHSETTLHSISFELLVPA